MFMKAPELPVLRRLVEAQVVAAHDIENAFREADASAYQGTEESALAILAAAGEITPYQVSKILDGRLDELVLGNYVILGKLGAGGMGAVFKARHKRMKRVVALKMLNSEMLENSAGLQRFQREVESIAKLAHPGVVAAYDADEGPGGYYLVMEFVEGDDLLNLVTKGGPFKIPRAVDTTIQAARAMAYVHAQGMVHRDIKPANFLVDAAGRVKVADLGLVRLETGADSDGETSDTEGITQACTIAGTLEYMAPEQAMDTKSADARADIYSLGCTLWFLLTGKVVYPAETQMKKVMAHQNEPIPSLKKARPDAPPLLEAVFKKMVAKSTVDRYQTMDEVVADLEKVAASLGGGAVQAPPPPPPADESTQMVDREALLGATGPAARPVESTQVIPASGITTRPVTVGLLVEPSRTQGMMIAKQLEQAGLQTVHRATSAGGALEALQDHPIGLVVTSYLLPDMTGLDLLARLRSEPDFKPLPFLLVSSSDENLALPPDAALTLLHKPFTPDQLATAVKTLQAKAGGIRRNPATLKVLLADDSPSARRRMRMALQDLGFTDITEAMDGKQAAGISDGQKFDLICTDFQMPEMTGGEFTAHARRAGPNTTTPILMCTSETDPQLLDDVRRAGVTRLVGKTASNQELSEAIRLLASI
jgi:serine/threonine-protein kinase